MTNGASGIVGYINPRPAARLSDGNGHQYNTFNRADFCNQLYGTNDSH